MAIVVFLQGAASAMAPVDFIKLVASVIGILVSMPMLVAVFRVTLFVSQMKVTVEQTAEKLTAFTERVDRVLEDHSAQITTNTSKIEIMWNGAERRSGRDRRND